MGEENGHDRRKDGVRFAKFMGEMEDWKNESIEWRKKTDKSLEEIAGFMDEVRTPRKIIVWAIRAFFIAAIGSIVTSLLAFIKGHIKFN